MSYPCIESTVEFDLLDYRIRLWINEEKLPKSDSGNIKAIEQIKKELDKGKLPTRNEVAKYIADNYEVNAVQVQDANEEDPRCGVVIYTVEFGDNVHG